MPPCCQKGEWWPQLGPEAGSDDWMADVSLLVMQCSSCSCSLQQWSWIQEVPSSSCRRRKGASLSLCVLSKPPFILPPLCCTCRQSSWFDNMSDLVHVEKLFTFALAEEIRFLVLSVSSVSTHGRHDQTWIWSCKLWNRGGFGWNRIRVVRIRDAQICTSLKSKQS